MSPPKHQRDSEQGNSSSPVKKKPKSDLSKPSGVKGQGEAKITTTMAASAPAATHTATRKVLDMGSEQPEWFKLFYDDFKNLETRIDNMVIKRLDDFAGKLNEHDEKLKAVEFDMKEITDKAECRDKTIEALEIKIDELENRSRRNNLVFYGVPEPARAEREDCLKTMQELLVDFVGLEIDVTVDIDRCHRTPTYRRNEESSKPRMIHVAFPSFVTREKVCKESVQKFKSCEFKGRKIFVADDLSRRVLQLCKKKMGLFNKLKAEKKKPFFIYPDKLRYRNGFGNLISAD